MSHGCFWFWLGLVSYPVGPPASCWFFKGPLYSGRGGNSKELKDKGEGAWGSCMLVEVIEARLAVITAYQLRKELINCASFHLFWRFKCIWFWCWINQAFCLFVLAQSFSRYHPSKGYWWQFKDGAESGEIHVYCVNIYSQLCVLLLLVAA